MLPFDPVQSEEICGLEIPKFGCLTVQESITLDDLFQDLTCLLHEADAALGNRSSFVVQQLVNPVLASILLVCRHNAAWSMQRVMAAFTPVQVEGLANFFLGERRRWQPLDGQGSSQRDGQGGGQSNGKPDNWPDVYWGLQLHYPGHPAFVSYPAFLSSPIIVVEQAIAAANRLELERANRAAIPIALLGSYTLRSQDLEPGHFNPFQRLLNQQQAVEQINPAIARTLIGLVDAGQVPSWAIPLIPLGKMRLAADAIA